MVDAISIVMFVVPLMTAIIFSMLTLAPKGKDKPSNLFSGALVTLFSAILASISWFIFGLTWPALASSEMFVSVGYLWYVIGIVFALFAAYVGFRMMGTIFETNQPQLAIQQNKSYDEEEE